MSAVPTIRLVDVKNLTPTLADAILRLLRRSYRNWPGLQPPLDARDHFRWKFEQSPNSAILGITEVDTQVIGLSGILRRTWLVKGEPVSVHDTVDLAVDPAWRGQGVYTRMFAFGKQHVDVNFDMSLAYLTRPQPRRVATRNGFRLPANPVRILVRPRSTRRVARHARQLGSIIPPPALASGLWAYQTLSRWRHAPLIPQAPQCAIRVVSRFDTRTDEFLNDAHRAFDLIQARSAHYLNWRYGAAAGGHFTIQIAEDGDRMLGYIVTRRAGEQGYIADLLALAPRHDVAQSLLCDALRTFDATPHCDAYAWLPRFHPYAELFRRAGFLNTGRGAGAGYRPVRIAAERLTFLAGRRARIHLMLGDSDHV